MERINTNPGSETNVNWFADGERANAAVLNRPIQDVSNIINNGLIDPVNNAPSIKPTLNLDFANTKQLDPRIDFQRPSRATYWDGKTTVKAEENLLTNSQTFQWWAKNTATITADTVAAPDGTTTADTFATHTSQGFHFIVLSPGSVPAGETVTYSIYAKAGTGSLLQLMDANNATVHANFDVTSGAGAVTATGTGVTSAAIEDVGNDWYRCSLTYYVGSTITSFYVRYINTATEGRYTQTAPASAFNFYIWGAQVELRDFITAYTPTTDQPITNYQPVLQTAAPDQPRFDHDPVTGESKGLLIEEQRTNLFPYSSDYSNANWTKAGVVPDYNNGIAPDGTSTATLLRRNSNAVAQYVYDTFTNSGLVTFSVYAKSYAGGKLVLGYAGGVAHFDLGTEVATTISGSSTNQIDNVGNGWYRCSMTVDGLGSSSQAQIITWSASQPAVWANRYDAGDNWSGVLVWGAQLELSSLLTSYIATDGASATRASDKAVITGNDFASWFNPAENTLFADFYDRSSVPARYVVESDTYSRWLYANANNANFNIYNGYGAVSTTAIQDGYNKFAVAYSEDDVYINANGFGVFGNTANNANFKNATSITIGSNASGSNHLNSWIRKLAFYPKRLPDVAMQALTMK